MRRLTGTMRLAATTLAAALAVAVLAGCAASHRVRGADKAGGSDAPLVLRLGDVDSEDYSITTRVLEYFGEQVAELSGGTLRVRVIYDAAGRERPDGEAQVARKVRDGSFDLGWIGAAAWDELGVTSFQALHAPFLVTDDLLLDRVATGPLAGSMLGGLRAAGVQGLALVPESLRNPVGLRRPLVSLGSFRGARLIVTPSRVTDAALRALGATPVHALGQAQQLGEADGLLESLVTYLGPDIVTGNASIFPVLHTLFANPASLRALTDAERSELEQAASRTLAHVVATRRSAQAVIARFCSGGRAASATGGGRVVLASRAELAALVRATRPVYSELERDPRTKRLISQIRALKRSLPPAPAIRVPRGCSVPRSVPPESGPTGGTAPQTTTKLDGTYRWVLTKADAIRFGQPPDQAPVGGVGTMTLRNGKWQIGEAPNGGTYAVTGNRIAFSWPSENSVLIFTFSRDRDGTLRLTPDPSVERGDRFVWSSEPWRRIGPPVRDIP